MHRPLDRLLKNWGYGKLAAKERAESIEEMQHADKLVDRIIFLEGHPNLQTVAPLRIGQNLVVVIDCDLEEEEGHIDFLETPLDLIDKLGIQNYGLLQASPASDEDGDRPRRSDSRSAHQSSRESWLAAVAPPKPLATAISATTVSQKDKAFSPISIRVHRGAAVTILNDDDRSHNVRIKQSGLDYNSGVQEPGDSVSLKFNSLGSVDVHCGIHPTMRLRIEVE